MGTGTYLVGTQNSVYHKSHGKCEAEGHEEGPPLSRRRRPLLQNQLTDLVDATPIRKVITQSIFVCLLRGKTDNHSRSYHERTIGVGHCRHNEPAPGAVTPFFNKLPVTVWTREWCCWKGIANRHALIPAILGYA